MYEPSRKSKGMVLGQTKFLSRLFIDVQLGKSRTFIVRHSLRSRCAVGARTSPHPVPRNPPLLTDNSDLSSCGLSFVQNHVNPNGVLGQCSGCTQDICIVSICLRRNIPGGHLANRSMCEQIANSDYLNLASKA